MVQHQADRIRSVVGAEMSDLLFNIVFIHVKVCCREALDWAATLVRNRHIQVDEINIDAKIRRLDLGGS